MRVLVLDGSAAEDTEVQSIVDMVNHELRGMNVPSEHVIMRDKIVAPCRHCYGCWVKTPGICLTLDDGPGIIRSWMSSDIVILVGRLSFGCYPSLLKNMMDRLVNLLHPYYISKRTSVENLARYEFYPSLLAVGVRDEINEQIDDTFRRLVHQNGVTLNCFTSRSLLVNTGESEMSQRAKVSSVVASMKVRK